jgi:hypothetical protein
MTVRYGSQADLFTDITPTAACGGKAVTQKQFFRSPWLNVSFHQERSFKPVDSRDFQRQLTAKSGTTGFGREQTTGYLVTHRLRCTSMWQM